MSIEKGKWVIPPQTELTEKENKESAMRSAFYDQYQEILNNPDRYKKFKKVVKIGLEMEYCFLDSTSLTPARESQRDSIIKALNEKWKTTEHEIEPADVELGAFQMELRTDPIDILSNGVNALHADLDWRTIDMKIAAENRDLLVLSCGTNPFIEIDEIQRTSKEKYTLVPNFHNENKRQGLNTVIGTKEQVDVRDAAVVAVCSAMQVNLEAKDFEDAVDKLNRSFVIVPHAMALGSNARFLAEKDTGLSELRMMAWLISHDTRTLKETERGAITRIGLPGIYYKNLEDCFQRMTAYPFILYSPENALAIATGLNWRDVRIKFIKDSAVVEFRPTSMQSTTTENIGIVLFYVGRLAWSQKVNEPLLNLKLIEENRNLAMIRGFGGEMWDSVDGKLQKESIRIVLARQIKRAKEGLDWLGIPEKQYKAYFDILKRRLGTGSPSEQLANRFYPLREKGFSRKEALAQALKELHGLY